MAQRRAYTVNVESWGISLRGTVRAENQDSFINWPDHMLWAVCDGVGGSRYGGEASRAISRELTLIPRPVSLESHLDNVGERLRRMNSLFREQAWDKGDRACSTVVALLAHGGEAACVWAGDSRCYLFRGGVLYQCTRDHSLLQETIDRGELTAPEARRMRKSNVITNAVGAHDALRLDSVRFSLRSGDRFLLCSDGLLSVFSPESLSSYLTRPSARESAEALEEALGDRPQPDNITLVAVFLSQLK
jgi:serine/threonine protein phosphatase PrpC